MKYLYHPQFGLYQSEDGIDWYLVEPKEST